MTIFNLPDLGEGLAEAEIVRWHVNVGDQVKIDQPMLAVETAKAVVEVPAPFSGIVKVLHGRPGDVIATGAPLIEFDLGAAAQSTRPAAAPANPAGDSGTVVGNVPTSEMELIETAHAGTHTAAVRTGRPSGRSVRAAPAARALAKSLGIDLAAVTGSGRGGVIVVGDVIAHGTPSIASARSGTAIPNTPTISGGEKLRGLRRSMAQSMSMAHTHVANCSLFDDADLHRWRAGEDVTLRLLRAIAAACQAEPPLNAWFDGASQTRRLMPQVNIGMAVDTPEGLIVPVLRDVGNRSSTELRAEIDRLKRAARERTLAPEDLREVTFLLSNFGMIAGRYATPVVVPPAVAILGAGRLSRDVVAVADRIEIHARLPLSLTFDHRCVTGGEAARFLSTVLCDLEKDR